MGAIGERGGGVGNISAEDCQNLIEGMPRRVQNVIKAKGGIQVLKQ